MSCPTLSPCASAGKTPSFSVSPAKNLCKCFACGKGGNPVHFIMLHEQLSYPDALRYLAKKYHIEIKEREQTVEEKAAQTERDSLFIVNQFANDYFRRTLRDTDEGRNIGLAYLRSRGFRDDTRATAPRATTPSPRKPWPRATSATSSSRPASATRQTTTACATASGAASSSLSIR